MRVVQTVFGVFHHFELARELEQRGHLQRIYSTWPRQRLKREALPSRHITTFPWYHTLDMLSLRAGISPRGLRRFLNRENALQFDRFVSRHLRRESAPDALIALSGSSLKAGTIVQQHGGVFICDRGSSHARVQEQLVSEEYRRWGVTREVGDPRLIAREEEIYATADAISVPSSFAARSFHDMGVDPSRVHVIPYGVRLEQFRPVAKPAEQTFQVLFAGSVGLRKGFPYLLQAFQNLQHPHKRLVVAGTLQDDIKSVLPRLPQQHVEYLNSVPQRQLVQLMSESHVMVLPSIEEGLALVQGQALACGCPVIASTNTGAEDLFEDGVEGFILPIRSPDLLLSRMQLLADSPSLRQQMSEAALRRVSVLGGWREYGDAWEALLYRLTGVPPPTK